MSVMQKENKTFDSPKEVVHRIVELLEETGNVARLNNDAVKDMLAPEQFARFEKLSLSVCYDLLEASDFDNELI